MIEILDTDDIKTYKLDDKIKKAVDNVRKSVDNLGEVCGGFKLESGDQTTAIILNICKNIYDKSLIDIGTIYNMIGEN